MFKIISRKKYKELLATQELADARNMNLDVLRLTIRKNNEEIDRLKARLNEVYGVNAIAGRVHTHVVGERNLLAEEFRKAEDCIDDLTTLLGTISDKCNINAIKAAKSRIGLYYTDPKVNAAIHLAARCVQVEKEEDEAEEAKDKPSKIDGDALTEELRNMWDRAIGPDPEEKEEPNG